MDAAVAVSVFLLAYAALFSALQWHARRVHERWRQPTPAQEQALQDKGFAHWHAQDLAAWDAEFKAATGKAPFAPISNEEYDRAIYARQQQALARQLMAQNQSLNGLSDPYMQQQMFGQQQLQGAFSKARTVGMLIPGAGGALGGALSQLGRRRLS